MIYRSRPTAVALLLASQSLAAAENSEPIETALESLIAETLQANFELEAAEATAAERLAEVDEARARFRPTLDLLARYSRADGGRSFDVPVGDLLNPVYAGLAGVGGPALAPVANQRIDFVRSEEQDTRIVLTQSIYDARIRPAVEASRHAHASATAAASALRGRLTRDVKQGYYAWLAARDGVAILESSIDVGRSNLSANQSLFNNGRVTRDFVLRAETDLLELEQQRLAAEVAVTIAASYVNVLRRAPLDRDLPVAPLDSASTDGLRAGLVQRLDGAPLALEPLTALALAQRPELTELDAALAASAAQEDVARAALKPRVAFALDAGSQGENYGFDDDHQFVVASVVVRFSPYSGGGNQARVRASRAASEALRARRAQAGLGIELEVQQAFEQLAVADASLATATKRVAAAEAAFQIVSRKRDLGQINQTEFIDARNALTESQWNLSRTRATTLARLADLEYSIGLIPGTQRTDRQGRRRQ